MTNLWQLHLLHGLTTVATDHVFDESRLFIAEDNARFDRFPQTGIHRRIQQLLAKKTRIPAQSPGYIPYA